MFCKNCGIKLDDDAVFCSKCGTHKDSMDTYLYCEKCGAKITEDAAFCTGCGRAIPEEILETKKKLLQEKQKKEDVRDIKIALGIAAFFIILLILGGLASGSL